MIEIFVNLLGIAISAMLYFGSSSFRVSKRPGVPSASFFPTIIAVILLVLGVYNIIMVLIKRKKLDSNVDADTKSMSKLRLLQFVSICALLVLYAVLWLFHLGHFILNTAVIFTGVCWLMSDEREWWKTLIYITVLTIFIYILFGQFLRVRIW